MKIKIVCKMVVFILVMIVFVGCNKTKEKREMFIMEYYERFSQAYLPFADEKIIITTIAYMDDIISKEGNKNIFLIYYDKAGLFFKLEQYDKALDALFQSNDEIYDIYKATLLIRLGRNDDATPFLQRVIDKNNTEIIMAMKKNKGNIFKEVKYAIQLSMMMYILADKSYEFIINEFTSMGIISQQEIEELLLELLVFGDTYDDIQKVKELFLKSEWPGIEDVR
jgi:tetratricopeptide (TPR) repeat protein